jgi:hypothetical protein
MFWLWGLNLGHRSVLVKEFDSAPVHPLPLRSPPSVLQKALDNFDPDFARDARNVRIELAIDGFTPFIESAASYSCWPVFAITYNLLLALGMKYEHMFLCLIVPGPDSTGPQLNVMMQPLIEEFRQLWVGVEAYDCQPQGGILVVNP